MADVQTPIISVVGDHIRRTPGAISLAQGVVSYPPPPAALKAAQQFGSDPRDHLYGASAGQAGLIDAISRKLRDDNAIESDLTDRILVTAGANMAFLTSLFAVLDPGDEVILPTPYYFNHEMAIRMVSGIPVLVETDASYQLSVDTIAAAITPRTRAVVTVSPNNPTGVVYSRDTLRAINALCEEKGLYHICDEAYEYFTYDNVTHFSPLSLPDAEAHTIGLYSLSKAYGFASWRVGYMVIPRHLRDAIMKVQDTNLICNTVIAQEAAQAALSVGATYCRYQVAQLADIRTMILDTLKSEPDLIQFAKPDGAFYVMLKLATEQNDLTLVHRLIEEHKVGVLPGSAFGIDKCCTLRVSFGALTADSAKDGLSRLMNGLRSICYNADD